MAIIRITTKCKDDNSTGISSYYYTLKDHKILSNFADAVNCSEGSDIRIKIITNPEEFVPISINLEDRDLRYFNIVNMFKDPSKPSQYTIDKIAEECAYNEDYCNFICDTMVELTEKSAKDAEIGKFIANTVIDKAIKILEKHKECVTNAFYKYSKSYNMSFCKNTEDSNKLPEMTMEIGNDSACGIDNKQDPQNN